MAEISSSEKYAQPEQRPVETPKVGERDSPLSWLSNGPGASNNSAAEKLNDAIRRVASASTNEIDVVIRMLENVREMISKEGERVRAEIVSYVSLSRSAKISMKAITDGLKQWNDTAN
jgi:hypothetical protein